MCLLLLLLAVLLAALARFAGAEVAFFVDNAFDYFRPSAEFCTSAADFPRQCNLRSAWRACLSVGSEECVISLPEKSLIGMNGTLGELSSPSTLFEFHISIIGNGATIESNTNVTRFISFEGAAQAALSSLLISNISFSGFGDASLDGGVLFIDGNLFLDVQNCAFESSEGLLGGSVYITNNTAGSRFEKTTFHYSRASSGGALYFDENCRGITLSQVVINDSQAINSGGGVVLNNNNSDVFFFRTMFQSARSTSRSGGAIFLGNNNINVTFSQLSVLNCNASYGGGGICLANNNRNVTIVNSSFERVSAGEGGAIFLWTQNDFVSIRSSNFEEIQAISDAPNGDGGAILVGTDNDHFVLFECQFRQITAASDGGVISFNSSNLHARIDSCNFEEALAGGLGGVVHADFGNDELTLSRCVFFRTTAQSGGTIALMDSNMRAMIDGNVFNLNLASHFASILGLVGGGNNMTTFSNNEIIDCGSFKSTDGFDPLVKLEKTNSYFYFVNNTIGEYTNGTISFSWGLQVTDSPFLLVQNCTFNHRGLKTGGGIYLYRSSFATIQDSRFQDCRGVSGSGGGGMYIQSSNDIELAFDAFNNCSAIFGGALGITSSSRVSISNSTFFGNTASVQGGAVTFHESNDHCYVLFCEMAHNYAPLGGAVSLEKSNNVIYIVASHLHDNAATIGGAVFSNTDNRFLMMTDSVSYLSSALGTFQRLNNSRNIYTKTVQVANASAYLFGFHDIHAKLLAFMKIYVDGKQVGDYVSLGVYPGAQSPATLIEGNEVRIDITILGTSNCTQAKPCGLDFFIFPVLPLSHTSPTVFENNAASKGGAVAMNSNSFGTYVWSSIISNNKAQSDGGAIFSQLLQTMSTYGNTIFTGNAAQANGGAVSELFGDASVQYISNTFSANSARQNGGAVYFGTGNGVTVNTFPFKSKSIVLKENEFRENAAGLSGGALYLESENDVQVDSNNVFSSNAAKVGNGGAIMLNSFNVMNISSATLESNNAFSCGGGLASMLSNSILFSVSPSFLSHNHAHLKGGGLCLVGKTQVTIDTHLSMVSNKAQFGGGAYWSEVGIWTLSPMGNISLIGNAASRGSALFMSSLLSTQNSSYLRNMSFIGNIATGGGTVYWVYDEAAMAKEPPGLRSASNQWLNNTAPYGVMVGTPALTLSTPSEYEVTQFGAPLYPPVVASLYDYYGQFVRINDTIASISVVSTGEANVSIPKCFGFPALLSGQDVLNGVTFSLGYASFSQTTADCAPHGTFTVSVSVNLADQMDTSIQETEKLYLTNYVLFRFRSCKAGEIEKNGKCVTCAVGSFSLASHEVTCQDCSNMAGVEACQGNEIVLKENHWRRTENHTAVFACPRPGSCVGGNETGSALCSLGHEGPLCSVCSAGYYVSSDNVCTSCEGEKPFSFAFYALFAVLVVGTVVIVYFYFISLRTVIDKTESMIERYVMWIYSQYDAITVRSKIVVSTYQIVYAAGVVLAVSMPASFNKISRTFSFVNLNFASLFPVGCATKITYFKILVLTTMSPIAAILALFLVFSVEYRFLRKQLQMQGSSRKEDIERQYEVTKNKYLNIFFYLVYFVLPSVTTTIFQMFVCQNIDPNNEDNEQDDYFLVADMSVSCESETYRSWIPYGVFMIVLYPVGVPAMYFFLLYQCREKITNRDKKYDVFIGESQKKHQVEERTNAEEQSEHSLGQNNSQLPPEVSRLSFLWSAYEPQYWYWEIIETLRRVMLTAILSVVSPGSSEQNVLSILLALVFIKLYSTYRPYLKERDDVLCEVGQIQILLTFLCALVINNNLLANSWASLMDWLLILVNFGVMFLVAYDNIANVVSADEETKEVVEETYYKGIELHDLYLSPTRDRVDSDDESDGAIYSSEALSEYAASMQKHNLAVSTGRADNRQEVNAGSKMVSLPSEYSHV